MTDERQAWRCVVAMLERTRVGARHPRAAWPAHITLAGNHRLDEPGHLPALVDDALRGVGTLDVRLGRTAWFGESGDVPVLLVASPAVERAHERLASRLVELPGFGAEAPHQWRTGYRPHVTLGPAARVPDGKEPVVRCVAIARLVGADAVVEAVLPAPASPGV